VVIAGDAAAADSVALRRAAWSVFAPNRVVLGTAAPAEEFARSLPARDGKATAYVCSGKFCHLPTTDPATVAAHLSAPPPTTGAGASKPE